MQWHIYLGYCTGILILIRILWGLVGPVNARLSKLITSPRELFNYSKTLPNRQPSGLAGHNPLGAISVLIILVLLSIQVITGLFSEDDALFYSGPFTHMLSAKMIIEVTAIHHLCAKLILIVVSLHICAVLFYLIWKKENLIKAMITGNKLVKGSSVKDDSLDSTRIEN